MPVRKRVEFSAPTKLVFAELDTSMPFNAQALREMAKKRIIVPVARNALLRKRFKAAGYSAKQYARVYAVPFRFPEHERTPEKFHFRSLHTLNAGKRQFVFKGSGAGNKPTSFKRVESHQREHHLWGGAKGESIKHAVDTLAELEETYENAKSEKDWFLKWAEKYGVDELPVMKHAAVFRPLQFLHRDKTKNGKATVRRPINAQTFGELNLSEFLDDIRMHVYTAREPTRLEEGLEKGIHRETKKAIRSVKQGDAEKEKILANFIARGLVLLHVGNLADKFFSYGGSSLMPQNASTREFFDFDTTINGGEKRENYMSLINSIEHLAKELKGGEEAVRNETKYYGAAGSQFEDIRATLDKVLEDKVYFDVYSVGSKRHPGYGKRPYFPTPYTPTEPLSLRQKHRELDNLLKKLAKRALDCYEAAK